MQLKIIAGDHTLAERSPPIRSFLKNPPQAPKIPKIMGLSQEDLKLREEISSILTMPIERIVDIFLENLPNEDQIDHGFMSGSINLGYSWLIMQLVSTRVLLSRDPELADIRIKAAKILAVGNDSFKSPLRYKETSKHIFLAILVEMLAQENNRFMENNIYALLNIFEELKTADPGTLKSIANDFTVKYRESDTSITESLTEKLKCTVKDSGYDLFDVTLINGEKKHLPSLTVESLEDELSKHGVDTEKTARVKKMLERLGNKTYRSEEASISLDNQKSVSAQLLEAKIQNYRRVCLTDLPEEIFTSNRLAELIKIAEILNIQLRFAKTLRIETIPVRCFVECTSENYGCLSKDPIFRSFTKTKEYTMENFDKTAYLLKAQQTAGLNISFVLYGNRDISTKKLIQAIVYQHEHLSEIYLDKSKETVFNVLSCLTGHPKYFKPADKYVKEMGPAELRVAYFKALIGSNPDIGFNIEGQENAILETAKHFLSGNSLHYDYFSDEEKDEEPSVALEKTMSWLDSFRYRGYQTFSMPWKEYPRSLAIGLGLPMLVGTAAPWIMHLLTGREFPIFLGAPLIVIWYFGSLLTKLLPAIRTKTEVNHKYVAKSAMYSSNSTLFYQPVLNIAIKPFLMLINPLLSFAVSFGSLFTVILLRVPRHFWHKFVNRITGRNEAKKKADSWQTITGIIPGLIISFPLTIIDTVTGSHLMPKFMEMVAPALFNKGSDIFMEIPADTSAIRHEAKHQKKPSIINDLLKIASYNKASNGYLKLVRSDEKKTEIYRGELKLSPEKLPVAEQKMIKALSEKIDQQQDQFNRVLLDLMYRVRNLVPQKQSALGKTYALFKEKVVLWRKPSPDAFEESISEFISRQNQEDIFFLSSSLKCFDKPEFLADYLNWARQTPLFKNTKKEKVLEFIQQDIPLISRWMNVIVEKNISQQLNWHPKQANEPWEISNPTTGKVIDYIDEPLLIPDNMIISRAACIRPKQLQRTAKLSKN